MLNTTLDLYQETLDGIKKESSATLIPEKWNRLINQAQRIWLREKLTEIEKDQKRIDDLRSLLVFEWIEPALNLGSVPTLFSLPPRYVRMLNVLFTIEYVDNECGLTGSSDWLTAAVLRSDQKTALYRNPFRRPKDSRLYYQMIGDKIYLFTGTSSYGKDMRIDYIREPGLIFFNQTAPADIPFGLSQNCELPEFQKQEIVDIAVRIYLEKVLSPRYKSYLQEEMIKGRGK